MKRDAETPNSDLSFDKIQETLSKAADDFKKSLPTMDEVKAKFQEFSPKYVSYFFSYFVFLLLFETKLLKMIKFFELNIYEILSIKNLQIYCIIKYIITKTMEIFKSYGSKFSFIEYKITISCMF